MKKISNCVIKPFVCASLGLTIMIASNGYAMNSVDVTAADTCKASPTSESDAYSEAYKLIMAQAIKTPLDTYGYATFAAWLACNLLAYPVCYFVNCVPFATCMSIGTTVCSTITGYPPNTVTVAD